MIDTIKCWGIHVEATAALDDAAECTAACGDYCWVGSPCPTSRLASGISEFAPKKALEVGAELPNLRPELITVIDEEASDVQ